MDTYLSDNSQAWLLQADGSYAQIKHKKNQKPIQAQTVLLQELQGQP
jgi:polyphosphate kinase